MPTKADNRRDDAPAPSVVDLTPTAVRTKTALQVWPFLLAIVAATVVAYGPVLFNWFAGDDFVHLTWLRHAIHQPELIAKNFYSSWLDGTTTKFYRPLISVFMVTDYFFWRANGLGFHLTNLTFHILSSLALFGVVKEAARHLTGREDIRPALLSAAIFALYPLHPEAVSWITGRVDSVVTTFCLGSIYAYLLWRKDDRPRWLALSIASLICGLLSKEMAITVPAVLVLLELLAPKPRIATLARTAPFWGLLAVYFVVRRLALGTFVGGYDDSLLFIANPKEFILNWLHAIRMTLVPINKEILGSHHLLTKFWEVLVVAAAPLLVSRIWTDPQSRRPLLFTLGWLVLCLLPVYKLFAIADDLQGSRLAYLATVPLSVIFAYAFSSERFAKWQIPQQLRTGIAISFCGLCAVLLLLNNQPWRQAGREANAIRASLQKIYDKEHADPQRLLIGMPDQIKGAYISRNAIWGMTKYPQLSGDVWNCLTLNQFEPVHPFGYLKDSMAENKADIRVFRWSHDKKTFIPLTINSGTTLGTIEVVGPTELKAARPRARTSALLRPQGISCWDTDFVRVNLNLTSPGTFPTGADLLYANDINPEFQLGRRTHSDITAGQEKQSLLFALRSLPEWSFGNNDARLRLLLPPDSTATIESAEIVPAAKLMPKVEFAKSGYMGTKGYFHLGNDRPSGEITVDASKVQGAASAELEITRANLLFEEQNGRKYSSYAKVHQPVALTGTVRLDKKDFTSPGIYELRAWAKDATGNIIGVASDHIVISVDP